MNPKAFAGIVLLSILILAIIIGIGYLILSRSAGIRRKEYEAMRVERNNAWTALAKIDAECDSYNEMDSYLASQIKPIIRTHDAQKMEIHR